MTEHISDKYLYPLGRFLLGLYFLLPGLAKVFLFQENLEVVIEREVPFPSFSLSLMAVVQIFFWADANVWETCTYRINCFGNSYLIDKFLYP